MDPQEERLAAVKLANLLTKPEKKEDPKVPKAKKVISAKAVDDGVAAYIEKTLRALPDESRIEEDPRMGEVLQRAFRTGEPMSPADLAPVVTAQQGAGIKLNVLGAARAFQYSHPSFPRREDAALHYGISVATVGVYWLLALLFSICPALMMVPVTGINFWHLNLQVILRLFGLNLKQGPIFELVDGGTAFFKWVRERPFTLWWGKVKVSGDCRCFGEWSTFHPPPDNRPRRCCQLGRHWRILAESWASCEGPPVDA